MGFSYDNKFDEDSGDDDVDDGNDGQPGDHLDRKAVLRGVRQQRQREAALAEEQVGVAADPEQHQDPAGSFAGHPGIAGQPALQVAVHLSGEDTALHQWSDLRTCPDAQNDNDDHDGEFCPLRSAVSDPRRKNLPEDEYENSQHHGDDADAADFDEPVHEPVHEERGPCSLEPFGHGG